MVDLARCIGCHLCIVSIVVGLLDSLQGVPPLNMLAYEGAIFVPIAVPCIW